MNLIKNNPFISLLIGVIFSCTLSFVFFAQDQENLYEEIHIKKGDTLWTLSEKYRGTTPKHDWISKVMVVNNLNTQMIYTGDALIIPKSIKRYTPDHQLEYAGDLK